MELFGGDDQGYINWYNNNSDGFVLNYLIPMTANQPMVQSSREGRQFLMLHKATCGTITGIPANGRNWTYIWGKLCSKSKSELVDWTQRKFKRQPAFCGLCRP